MAIGATGDDSASGNHNITGGRWSIDDPAGPPTAMTLAAPGPWPASPAVIPAGTFRISREGQHTVTWRPRTPSGNWGDPSQVILYVDRAGPGGDATRR